jgi:anti-sigma B factor antagonist
MSDLAHRPLTSFDHADALLSTTLTHGDACVAVAVRGELDLASTPRFEREVLALISLPITTVRLDLDGLDFIDSSGVSGLDRIRVAAEEHRVRLELAGVPAQARKVLDLTGVAGLFTIVDSPPRFTEGFD